VTSSATHRAIDAVWRIESARLIAGLTRIVRDVAVAEDLAQDALVAALEQWPESGIPDKPGAWLMVTAKRRGIDALRRRVALERKRELRTGSSTAQACGAQPMSHRAEKLTARPH
jgi:predicted RNA polymerase sigma factor